MARSPDASQSVAFPLPGHGSGAANASRWSPSGQVVAAGLLIFAGVWLLHLGSVSLSPPVDNIEQLTWVRSLQWGYYKHPPLPTWLLWVPVHLLGLSASTASVLGAAVTLGAMAILWRLLHEMRGPRYAAVALLAALCITYYNGRLNYYNHNVVLLLAVVASAWCCWRAFEEKRLRWWAALGLAIGLGALAKYQIAVTVLSVLCFWISQRGWREPVHVRGALLATLIALLVFTPHLLWLPEHEFGPIRYALTTSLGVRLGTAERLFNAAHWVIDQLLNRSLPAFLLLGACAYGISRAKTGAAGPVPNDPNDAARRGRPLILCWALVPLVFMPAVGIAFGADLQLQWGTAFLPFVVPAAMELKPAGFWSRARLGLALKVFVALQAFLLVLSYVTSPVGIQAFADHHWRGFGSKSLADAVAAPARARLGGPIRVVIGDQAIAGALALQLPENPVVLLEGHFRNSPWVTRELVGACGALELVHAALQPSNATPVGAAFPGLYWRSIEPHRTGSSCWR